MKNKKLLITVIIVLFLGMGIYTLLMSKSKGECITLNSKELCTSEYEGLSQSEASSKASADKLTVKIREIDGDKNITNTDLGGKPIYFTIKNGKVSKAEFN